MRGSYRPGLSEPTRIGPSTTVLAVGVIALFLVVVALVYVNGHLPLLAVPAMATAHAVAMVSIYATTGALLVAYARASGEIGYLVAAGTFFFVAAVMSVFTLAYPNAIVVSDPPTILWGTRDSAVALFHIWQFAVVLGLPAASIVIARHYRTGRIPGLGKGVAIMWAAVVGATIACAMLVGPLGGLLPPLVDGITATSTSKALFWAEMVLALVGTVIVGRHARHGSTIGRWMFVAMLVTWGGAVASLAADRYSLAWYYNRVVGLAAALILLILLIRDIGRVERETLDVLGRDALTGASSREGVLSALDSQLRRSHHLGVPVSVLWIDLDGFQGINERFGEHVGDQVLVETYERIRASLDPGCAIGRAGGDDFIVVVPGADEESTSRIADQLLAHLREPHVAARAVGVVTASIGVAGGSVPGAGDSLLVREAMVALQAARQGGGDRTQWYTDEHGTEAAERARLRQELGKAVRDDEFVLQYQPIVDLRDGSVAGAEVLVRWLHDGELLPAGAFIDFATQSGMITGVGRRVLDRLEVRAPAMLATLPPPFFLAFNLSVRELADATVVKRLAKGPLSHHAGRLVVEVTEEFELSQFFGAGENLGVLRAAGYRVALDDFGSGFSNLSRMTQLRPAIVKIDRGVIVQAGLGVHGGLVTLSAAVDIARAMGSIVLAEGLETNDEAAACMRADVELAQGYRFARSLDEDALAAFCDARMTDGSGSLGRRGKLAGHDTVDEAP